MNNYNRHHKNLTGGSSKQSNIAGSFYPPIKYLPLLGHKWRDKRVDHASNETSNKTYAIYMQHELKVKKLQRF